MDALVHVLAPVTVRPAVEPALLYRGKVVGNKIGTDLVALVDDGEQLAGSWLNREICRIARSGRVNPLRACQTIDLVDGRTTLLDRKAVLGNVAVGPDPDIKLGPVGARNQ